MKYKTCVLNKKIICIAIAAPINAMAVPEINEVEEHEKRKKEGHQIVVSATRTPRNIESVPVEVIYISNEKIQQLGAQEIKDVLKNEIDLSVKNTQKRYGVAAGGTGRAGNEGINIRGLEGNQILILEDGIRLPSSFNFGPISTGRGDLIEIDSLSNIEILRGANSTLYGSDGLGGVVYLTTLNPEDIFKNALQDAYVAGFAKVGSVSVNQSKNINIGLGVRNEKIQTILYGSSRLQHEVSNQGAIDVPNSHRTSPNPLDGRNQHLLAKILLSPDRHQKIGVVFERNHQHLKNYLLSGMGEFQVFNSRGPITVDVKSLIAEDDLQRDRVSLNYEYKNLSNYWIKKINTHFYWQDARVHQNTYEQSSVDNLLRIRTRLNNYQENLIGISTQFESHWEGLGEHRITYGLNASMADIKGKRDGVLPNYPEFFPIKPFPDTRYQLAGIFLQDEIELGKFSVIPGVRFDQYRLSPSIEGYSDEVQSSSGSAFTPRLGVVWNFHSIFSPYAQYSQGYRAPSPDQVNSAFANRLHGYISSTNPDLKPEHARSFEFGARGYFHGFRYQGVFYDNQYKDFITQEKVSGEGHYLNPSIYQYVNATNAHIKGGNLQTMLKINHSLNLTAGIGYAKGSTERLGNKAALNSIEPLKIILGLEYKKSNWSMFTNWRYAAAKNKADVSPIRINANQMAEQFIPPSAQVWDLGFRWIPVPNLTIYANVNNLLNNNYWNWSDVRGVSKDSSVLQAYTAPGRNFSLSVRYDY